MCGLTQRFQVVKYVYYCKFCAKVFMLKCKYQSYINVSQLEQNFVHRRCDSAQ